MTFHVLTCPEASGQCLKVRWLEQRPITSNFLESLGTQPRKYEVLTLFDPHLSRSPCFLEPLSDTFQRALLTGWGLSKFWYLEKESLSFVGGPMTTVLWARVSGFPGCWTQAELPFMFHGPLMKFPYPFFFFLELSFFFLTYCVVVTLLSALENALTYM